MPWKGIFGIFSSAQSLRDLQILTPTFYKLDLYLKKKKKNLHQTNNVFRSSAHLHQK